MSNYDSTGIEGGLLELANSQCIKKCKVKLKKYQSINFYINSSDVFKTLIKVLNFKNAGNVYDYPDIMPQPESINMYGNTLHFNNLFRIAYSNKLNAILYYSANSYMISCVFLVDVKRVKKFMEKTSEILKEDTGVNIFRDTDFSCGDKQYIEIMNSNEDQTKEVDVVIRSIVDENLVFDKKSTINDVMNDITSFFKNDTKKLYGNLDLAYKRGIILYGEPGNGKSAMIRQLIRSVSGVSKIVINPNVPRITNVLSSLTNALNGTKAIIIIEDIDSVINEVNRSEFLNILDGINIKDGLYFIGTTNYPDKIDPAIMNRSGRFDRTYEINNPIDSTRRLFFESRKVGKLFKDYQLFEGDYDSENINDTVVDLFVEFSKDLPMASLKELITSTAYLLVSGEEENLEDSIISAYNNINKNRIEHINSHNKYNINNYNPFMPNNMMHMSSTQSVEEKVFVPAEKISKKKKHHKKPKEEKIRKLNIRKIKD